MRIPDFAIVLVVVAIVASIFLWLPDRGRVPEPTPSITRTPEHQNSPELRLEVVGEPRNLNELTFRITVESRQPFSLHISNGTPVAGFAIRSAQQRWYLVRPVITDRMVETDYFSWEIKWADFDEDHTIGLSDALRSQNLVAEVTVVVYPKRLVAEVGVPKFPPATLPKDR